MPDSTARDTSNKVKIGVPIAIEHRAPLPTNQEKVSLVCVHQVLGCVLNHLMRIHGETSSNVLGSWVAAFTADNSSASSRFLQKTCHSGVLTVPSLWP